MNIIKAIMVQILVMALPAIVMAQIHDQPKPNIKLKSEKKALWLSLGSTVVPILASYIIHNQRTGPDGWLMGSGVLIGPSIGYFYIHKPKRALIGIGIRAATAAVTFEAANAIMMGTEDKSWDESLGSLALAITVVGAGGALIVTDAIVDIRHVQKAAREQNAKIVSRTTMSIVPTYIPFKKYMGVRLAVRF